MKLIPALFTSTSTLPQRFATPATERITTPSSEISPRNSFASASLACTADSVASHGSTSISASAYPASASTSAVRRPIPCAAPVITATFIASPFSENGLVTRFYLDRPTICRTWAGRSASFTMKSATHARETVIPFGKCPSAT